MFPALGLTFPTNILYTWCLTNWETCSWWTHSSLSPLVVSVYIPFDAYCGVGTLNGTHITFDIDRGPNLYQASVLVGGKKIAEAKSWGIIICNLK